MRRLRKWVALLALAVLVVGLTPDSTWAQSGDSQWSEPVRVGESGAFPTMVVDPAGRLHVMWTANTTEQKIAGWGDTLFYARRDDSGWSTPVDVLAAPVGSTADFPEMVLGTDGKLHVFWRMGSQIMYSWAPVSNAGSAHAWTTGRAAFILDPSSTNQFPYAVVADQRGIFHAVYVEVVGGLWGIAYVRSEDNGDTWSNPAQVSSAPPNIFASLPRLAIDSQGTIHVIWAQFQLPDGWPPTGVFYARSSDGGQTWSDPIQFGGELQGWANLVTLEPGIVHVVWNGSAQAAGRYDRWSSDSGRTWTDATMISRDGGLTQGWPGIAVDSARTVHVAMFGRGIEYLPWSEAGWSQTVVISSKESSGIASHPAIAVSEGNRLNVVWVSRAEENPGVWYTAKRTSAPWLPPAPISTVQPTPSMVATPSVTPTASVTATPGPKLSARLIATEPIAQGTSNPGLPVVLGILPVVVLIAGVVLMRAAGLGRR